MWKSHHQRRSLRLAGESSGTGGRNRRAVEGTTGSVVLAWARARPLVRPSKLVQPWRSGSQRRDPMRRNPFCGMSTQDVRGAAPTQRSFMDRSDRVPTATVGTESQRNATMAGCGDAECPLRTSSRTERRGGVPTDEETFGGAGGDDMDLGDINSMSLKFREEMDR